MRNLKEINNVQSSDEKKIIIFASTHAFIMIVCWFGIIQSAAFIARHKYLIPGGGKLTWFHFHGSLQLAAMFFILTGIIFAVISTNGSFKV